jgi:hypothetical protein
MKRYIKTFWNGMLEDPKGEWIKEKDATQEIDRILSQWRAVHSEYADERIKSLLITFFLYIIYFRKHCTINLSHEYIT